jgi:hypothetical protein
VIRALCSFACITLLLALAACETSQRRSDEFWKADRQQQFGPGRITPAGLQSEIMGFADLYADVVAEELDTTYLDPAISAEARLAAQFARLDMIENAIQIASGANPIVSMLDMTVMVGLQRHTWDTFWRLRWFDDETDGRIGAALERLDVEIWSIVKKALDEEQQGALRELIDQMCETYADQRYVSGIRASEFAQDRQTSFATVKGGGSLLTLFALDPLSNLSPATREIVESRLLAERVFFFAARLPEVMRGQARVLALEYFALPQSQRVLEHLDESVAAARRAVEVAEGLPDQLTAEREAAVDQVFERIAAEREAFFDHLDADEQNLSAILADLRAAIEAGGALSDSLQTTLVQGRDLADAIATLKQPVPGGRPLDVAELESATVAATETARELNTALESARMLLADEAWTERDAQIRQMTADVQLSMETVIDRLFFRALILAAAVGVILLLVLAINRFFARRGRPSAQPAR